MKKAGIRFSTLRPNDDLWADYSEIDLDNEPLRAINETKCMMYQKQKGGAYWTTCEGIEHTTGKKSSAICYRK